MANSGLVDFRCTAPGHQRTVQGRVADTLTIHERRWAFCPFDASGPGHRWEATGGVPLESLRQGSPRISISLDARPHPSSEEIAPRRPASSTSGARRSPSTKGRRPT